MYTDLKSYQIIIGLLKKYGIRHCVLSAGSRNVPFVHSVEQDTFFKCYSVVDERSAAYFAIGLAQELNEPVVISCTSSTATCNYWPAIAEAYYQNIPIIILTSDRDPRMLGNREDQMINQVGMYDRHVKKSVNLPMSIEDRDDWIYCQRLVNEALLELEHHKKGPVHINIPMKKYDTSFSTKELPEVKRFERFDILSDEKKWKEALVKLKETSRILILPGQNYYVSDKMKEYLEKFFKKYNSFISIEYMSNINIDGALNTSLCFDARFISKNKFKEFIPNIVISFGGNIVSGIKDLLRQNEGKFEHWSIQEEGKVEDIFKSLNNIFECTPEYFFKYFVENAEDNSKNDMEYYNLIKSYKEETDNFKVDYTNIYAIKNLVENIPAKSILHLSINNSIRYTNYFKLNRDVKVFANIGTFGIDGSMSSFIGQSVATSQLAFLIIGDLSFFYDMNSLKIKHIKNNVRIMLINNSGGEEFRYNGSWQDSLSDIHTCAVHNIKAEGWGKSVGFKYLSATNEEEFDSNLAEFISEDTDKPILFEVFTDMNKDVNEIYKIYKENNLNGDKDNLISEGKKVVKKVLGKENIDKLKKFLK